jgi:hypothetical protein
MKMKMKMKGVTIRCSVVEMLFLKSSRNSESIHPSELFPLFNFHHNTSAL